MFCVHACLNFIDMLCIKVLGTSGLNRLSQLHGASSKTRSKDVIYVFGKRRPSIMRVDVLSPQVDLSYYFKKPLF